MVIDQFRKDDVVKKFKAIYTCKEEAKDSNAAASDLFKTLATDLNISSKVIRKAYAIWVDEEAAVDTEEAQELVSACTTKAVD